MKIVNIKNEISETVKLMVDPEHIIQLLDSNGFIQNNTSTYGEKCKNMCNICTFIIGENIVDYCEENELVVHEGVFNMMGNHTWLEVEGTIIDMTARQFTDNCEKLVITSSDNELYQSVKKYTFEDWVENSPNVG